MNAQTCPICGAGSLEQSVQTETFEYKGVSRKIPNYITYTCTRCGEAVADNESLKKSGKMLKDFKREVDGLLTGQQIKAIRVKLGLTQKQLADIVGGGLKSIARYESGQVCQSKGMDNLLRILDAYPHTLQIIQRNEQATKYSGKIIYIEDARTNKGYQLRDTGYSSDAEEVVYGS
jgi:HTH-type transcriptional regulator / antitoxin MqsA